MQSCLYISQLGAGFLRYASHHSLIARRIANAPDTHIYQCYPLVKCRHIFQRRRVNLRSDAEPRHIRFHSGPLTPSRLQPTDIDSPSSAGTGTDVCRTGGQEEDISDGRRDKTTATAQISRECKQNFARVYWSRRNAGFVFTRPSEHLKKLKARRVALTNDLLGVPEKKTSEFMTTHQTTNGSYTIEELHCQDDQSSESTSTGSRVALTNDLLGVSDNETVESMTTHQTTNRSLAIEELQDDQSSEGTSTDSVDLNTYLSPVEVLHCQDDQSSEGTSTDSVDLNTYMSPTSLLIRWLQLDDSTKQNELWIKFNERFHRDHLPSVLVEFLHNSKNPRVTLKVAKQSRQTFQNHGFQMKDIKQWAQIVSVENADKRAEMFLADNSVFPQFILEAVLIRGNITRVKILDSMIVYASAQMKAIKPWQGANSKSRLLRTSSIQILLRLLRHARHILAPAIITISQMLPPTVSALLGSSHSEGNMLDARMHKQLCDLFNLMLEQLAMPASINPFRAMAYAWDAQKGILAWAGQFDPPLLLNQNGYRAVARVLAAQKKSENESRVSNLSARTWPPWRVEQDGMDAKRVIEEDFSKVVSTVMRMTESGYHETSNDSSLRILGGQESDGTPTIHTRSIRRHHHFTEGMPVSYDDKFEWAARVEATRDVQEAWSAFTKFEQLGGRPNIPMYFAMFEKLCFENARLGFDRTSHGSRRRYLEPVPGGSKEVFPPSNDNISEFYRMQLQPPSKDELYRTMVGRDNISPEGSFLYFLLSNSRVPTDARKYLMDSSLDVRAIRFLMDGADIYSDVRKAHIPDRLLAAFLRMLCRFVPRIHPTYQGTPDSEILELSSAPGKTISPLNHSIDLLKRAKPVFRPAWYAVFRALARRGTIIDRNLSYGQNDLLAWKYMESTINEFHRQNLELDPYGFLVICNGLEKAILASIDANNQDCFTPDSPALRFLEVEFENLCASSSIISRYGSLSPLHEIAGVHIHAYVRVLGLVEDYKKILVVLKWMISHNAVLDALAQEHRNGYTMIRRALISMRVFTGGTEHKTVLAETLNSSSLWGGWPSEEEVEEYLERWEKTPDELEDEAALELEEVPEEEVLEELDEGALSQ